MPLSDDVRTFLAEYERRLGADDAERVGQLYGDTFLFSGPQSAVAVRRDELVKVIPKRQAFFRSMGVTAMRIQASSDTALDENHVLVRVEWQAEIERDGVSGSVNEIGSTYLLRRHEQSFHIVAQVDHQDLTTRLQRSAIYGP